MNQNEEIKILTLVTLGSDVLSYHMEALLVWACAEASKNRSRKHRIRFSDYSYHALVRYCTSQSMNYITRLHTSLRP